MSTYFLRFVLADGRVAEPADYETGDITTARIRFRACHPRFFREVASVSLVSRKSGRVLAKEAL